MNADPTNDAPYVPASTVLPEELALAALAFRGSRAGSLATQTKHLAWLPPDSLDLDLSDPTQCLFGDYKLVEKLGQGGMGVVYRAQQLGLDREVAIKLLSAGPWAAPDFVMRFRAEAQSAARMQHPNIVPIYEIGAHDELVFYSMRLVRGPNLAQFVAKHGACDPRQAAMDLRTIAEAVHYAHQLGVLHLDLKPDNILIDERGWPQVADFGLARRLDHTLSAEIEEISGTPSYMAPEQATVGKRLLTPATDIYGLGAIFYEMLTGIPPFKDASPFETLKQVRELAPRAPRELRAEIPRDLEAICLKCLAKNVDRRYASARELAEDLMRYLDRRPVQARPLSSPARAWRAARREPKLATALATAVLILISGLIVSSLQWRRADDNASNARSTLWQARRDAARTAFDSGDWFNGLPGLAANIAEQEGNGVDAALDRVRLGLALGSGPRLVDQLRFEDGAVLPLTLSPDGTLLLACGAHLSVMYEVATGAQRWSIKNDSAPWEAQFESDGEVVQITASLPDERINGQTKWTRRFRARDGVELLPGQDLGNPTYLRYSRNGRYALAGRGDPKTELRQMQLWQTDSWQPVSPRRWLPRGYTELSDDGSRIYLQRFGMRVVDVLDAKTLATRLTTTAPGKSSFNSHGFSPDGRWFANGYDNGRVELLDTRTLKLVELPRSFSNRVNMISFSEDSAWMAAGSRDGDIRIWDTTTGQSATAPVRSGAEVAGDLQIDRRAQLLLDWAHGMSIWSLPPTPSEFALPVTIGPRMVINQHFDMGTLSVRGGWLATQNDDSGDLRIWRLPQSNLRHAHAAPLHGPDLVFDGTHLVAVDGARVSIVDAWSERPSAPPLQHPQPVSFAELSTDGATLVAVSGRELFAWDWRANQARFAPIVLANSPQRVVMNPAATSVLVAYTEYRDERMVEIAQAFGLTDGKALAPAVALPGPLRGLRFSADGGRLVYWRGNEVTVCDARTLLPLHDPFRLGDAAKPVFDGRIDPTGTLLATTQADQSPFWRLDPISGSVLAQITIDTQRAPVLAVTHDGKRIAAASSTGTFVLHESAKPRFLTLPEGVSPADNTAAYSPDDRLVAIGIKDGVQIFDAATGERIGPPLRVALDMHDGLIQLAFAADGESVLARTVFGHWLLWRVAPDRRPADEIAREIDILGYMHGEADMGALDSSTRAWLRSHDPGPPPSGDSDAAPSDPNTKSPPRDPATRAELLDLSPYYTSIAGGDFRLIKIFDLHQMPLGVQRLLGVDFDIRGRVQLAAPTYSMLAQEFPQRLHGIALPAEVAALDLLVGDYFPLDAGEVAAEAVLTYRDGGVLRLPLSFRTGPTDIAEPIEQPQKGEAMTDHVAPAAWLGAGFYTERWGSQPQRLYLERLVNPQPKRKLKSFSLVAYRALFLVAATAERPNL